MNHESSGFVLGKYGSFQWTLCLMRHALSHLVEIIPQTNTASHAMTFFPTPSSSSIILRNASPSLRSNFLREASPSLGSTFLREASLSLGSKFLREASPSLDPTFSRIANTQVSASLLVSSNLPHVYRTAETPINAPVSLLDCTKSVGPDFGLNFFPVLCQALLLFQKYTE